MAGIVRKLFKTAGGGSSRKKKEDQFEEDEEGDYSELHFGPSTSTPSTPSRAHKSLKSASKTPKIRHDETISDDDKDESDDIKDFREISKFGKSSDDFSQHQQQHLQIRHQNKPSLKRRRQQNPYGSTSSMAAASRMYENEEESIYEHAQYQLMAYGRQAERHVAKRRKRQEERHLEQENRVFQGIGGMRFEDEDPVDVGALRAERDRWKREAERYKARCVELEKRVKEMKQFQPFVNNTNAFANVPMFPSQAPPPTFLFQATPLGAAAGAAAGSFNFAPNFGANLNFQPNFAFSATPPPPSTSSATATTTMAATMSSTSSGRGGPAPFSLNPDFAALGPMGPMAPRYPDPVNDSLCFEDDDTSLSDLSNSSKSSEEGAGI